MYNQYAAPFIFLAMGLPSDFRKLLVTTSIHKVDSCLELLFVENGIPITHDFVGAITNYNLRMDTDVLCERAHEQVQKSVVEHLFNKPSDDLILISKFIQRYCNNMSESLSTDEARLLIRNSVRIQSLEVVGPSTKVLTTTYNIYIHPPTAKRKPLKSWRGFITSLRFHAGIYGVGVIYKHPWRCAHCKSIDHPAGLCPIVRDLRARRGTTGGTPHPEDDLLPFEPTPDPPSRPQNPNHGKRTNMKG